MENITHNPKHLKNLKARDILTHFSSLSLWEMSAYLLSFFLSGKAVRDR